MVMNEVYSILQSPKLELGDISLAYSKREDIKNLAVLLKNNLQKKIFLSGLLGSSSAFVLQAENMLAAGFHLVIMPDKEEAAYFYNDLKSIENKDNIHFFPSSYRRSVQYDKTETDQILIRTEILNCINQGENELMIVTYPEAIIETVVSKQNLSANTLQLEVGDRSGIEFIVDVLEEYKFERVDFVYEPGQYSLRGSIIDVFSFSNEDPYRLDFFGDELETIRSFNIENQLSKSKQQKITIVPNLKEKLALEKRISLFEFIPQNSTIWAHDLNYIIDRVDDIFYKTLEFEIVLIILSRILGRKWMVWPKYCNLVS